MRLHFLTACAPLAGLACNLLALIVWRRLFPESSLLKTVYGAFVAGAVFASAATLWPSFAPEYIVPNLIIYAVLGYGFFHFINMGETARRVRLVRELRDAGALTREELLEKYNAADILDVRLKRLLGSGQIVMENGKYRIGKPVMLVMAAVILWLKITLLGRKTEFDA